MCGDVGEMEESLGGKLPQRSVGKSVSLKSVIYKATRITSYIAEPVVVMICKVKVVRECALQEL